MNSYLYTDYSEITLLFLLRARKEVCLFITNNHLFANVSIKRTYNINISLALEIKSNIFRVFHVNIFGS